MPKTTRPNSMSGTTHQWGARAQIRRRGYTSTAGFAKKAHFTQAAFLRTVKPSRFRRLRN